MKFNLDFWKTIIVMQNKRRVFWNTGREGGESNYKFAQSMRAGISLDFKTEAV